MDLRHLRYFVSAVEEGSLRAAAERLNVAQPAVSRRIRDLEVSIGCSLLRRNVQGVQATEAGAKFYKRVVGILHSLDQAAQEARLSGTGDVDLVRLGLTQNSRRYGFVQEAISAFSHARGAVALSFLRAPSTTMEEELVENRLDLALLYDWFYGDKRLRSRASPVSHGLQERLIHKERYILALHPSHPLAAGGAASLAEVAATPLIWQSRDDYPEYFDSLTGAFREEGVQPSVAHIASNFDEMVDLAISTGGAFIAAASTRLSIPRDALVYRPLPTLGSELHLKLLWKPPIGRSASTLLSILQSAIDRHQDDVLENRREWCTLHGHQIVLLPSG